MRLNLHPQHSIVSIEGGSNHCKFRCKCGVEWGYEKNMTDEEVDEIMKRHVEYFSQPLPNTPTTTN